MSNTFQIVFIIIICILLIFNYILHRNDMGILLGILPALTMIIFLLGIAFWKDYFNTTFENNDSSMILGIIIFLGFVPASIALKMMDSDFHAIPALIGTLANVADIVILVRLFHLITLETYLYIVEFCAGNMVALFTPVIIILIIISSVFTTAGW